MSVIIVGLIVIAGVLSILSNFQPPPANYQAPKTPMGSSFNVNPVYNNAPPINITKFDAKYNFSAAVQFVNASIVYKLGKTMLFKLGPCYNKTLGMAIAKLLGYPANNITPQTYGELYNILDAQYTSWGSKTIRIYFYPMNLSANTTYMNFTFSVGPQFVNETQELEKNYPFPPSDRVDATLITQIIGQTTESTGSNNETTYYEYNVTLKLRVTVYNGSSITIPTTVIFSNAIPYYHVFDKRKFNATTWFTYWSYEGSKSVPIIGNTTDTITFLKYSITRYWNFTVTVVITPYSVTYKHGNKTYTDWYAHFHLVLNNTEPPSWIFQKIPPLNKTVVLNYSYFLNNVSIVYWLWYISNKTVMHSSQLLESQFGLTKEQVENLSYDVFDFILPQFVSQVYNRSFENMSNWTAILASFRGPWNITNTTLNVTKITHNDNLTFIEVYILPMNLTKKLTQPFIIGNNTPETEAFVVYSLFYFAFGNPGGTNVTAISYVWANQTMKGNFFPMFTINMSDNGTLTNKTYTPLPNVLIMHYGYDWPWKLPYVEFCEKKYAVNFAYWFNPGYQRWYQVD